MRAWFGGSRFRFWQACLAVVAVTIVTPAGSPAQTEEQPAAPAGEGAPAAAGAATGDSMERLKGAAGVGAGTATDEALKGGALGGAAKKGGSAAVQDYMKGPQGGAGAAGTGTGSVGAAGTGGAGAAGTGKAAPMKGGGEGEEPDEDDTE